MSGHWRGFRILASQKPDPPHIHMPDDNADRRDHGELVSAIAQAIRAEIAKLTVPEEIHKEHHAFISEWLDEQKRKRERHEKIRTQVAGWALVSVLGAIGKGGYELFQFIKAHWQ